MSLHSFPRKAQHWWLPFLLSREMETLFNGPLNGGTYEADWSADKIASGVYYYKLVAEDFTETRKMVLVK